MAGFALVMHERCRVLFFPVVVVLLLGGMASASARALTSPARSYAPQHQIEFSAYPACDDSLPPEMRNGLLVSNNPINYTDPEGTSIVPTPTSAARSVIIGSIMQHIYNFEKAAGMNPNDSAFHQDTSYMMASFGDPFSTWALGELLELIDPSQDKADDKDANWRGIERAVNDQIWPFKLPNSSDECE